MNALKDGGYANGFGEKRELAYLGPPLLRLQQCGQENDRGVTERRVGSDLSRHLASIGSGHINVAENDVRPEIDGCSGGAAADVLFAYRTRTASLQRKP